MSKTIPVQSSVVSNRARQTCLVDAEIRRPCWKSEARCAKWIADEEVDFPGVAVFQHGRRESGKPECYPRGSRLFKECGWDVVSGAARWPDAPGTIGWRDAQDLY